MRKRTYSLILGIGIGLIIAVVSSLTVYYFFGVKNVEEIRAQYDSLTNSYMEENMIDAYILQAPMLMDQDMSEAQLKAVKLPAQYGFTTVVNSIDDLSDYIATVNISKGAILQKEMMTSKTEIPNDLREFELQGLQIPVNMKVGDYVDIRVSFPSGLDFLVLSKKKVKEILTLGSEENPVEFCIFNLNTDEILRLKSAVVDAYINEGTILYSTIYVAPDRQKAAEVTYPVNDNVRKIIEDEPNIVSKAMRALDVNKRRILDESLITTRDDVDWNKDLAQNPAIREQAKEDKEELRKNDFE